MGNIQVVRKKRETASSLLKRFSRKIQQSGNLVRFKAIQFKRRNKSSLKRKKEALSRIRRGKKLMRLYKLGKVDLPNQQN